MGDRYAIRSRGALPIMGSRSISSPPIVARSWEFPARTSERRRAARLWRVAGWWGAPDRSARRAVLENGRGSSGGRDGHRSPTEGRKKRPRGRCGFEAASVRHLQSLPARLVLGTELQEAPNEPDHILPQARIIADPHELGDPHRAQAIGSSKVLFEDG